MLIFPEMLVPCAKEASIKVPADVDNYEPAEYPHWYVFCEMQLCRPMKSHSEHWTNAKVIASIPPERITQVTVEDLIEAGFSI